MTNKHENKYENLVIHCKSKEEWDWVLEHLPEGYSDMNDIKCMYNYDRCLRLGHGNTFYSSLVFYQRQLISEEVLVKAIISFQKYRDMFLQDQQEEANQYYAQPSKPNTKTLELLSKNISTFTKAAKLVGIDEKEIDSYSNLLIELSAGGVELSWTFHPNL